MAPRKRPTTKPTRAVCYVRISVDRDDETSTETQQERVEAYCTAHGLTVVDVIVEPGRSAYKTSRSSRPGFKKVMALVSSGAADAVIVWKLDRACRNTEDTLALVRELDGYGARLVSVTEQFDTSTATGRMMVTMLSGLAEMESATKSERVQVWQDKRLANRATPTGHTPFGYRRGDEDHPNELHEVKDQADVVRAAADRVLAGDTLRSILRGLEADGVVNPRTKKPLTKRGLRDLLLRPTIAGLREVDEGVFAKGKWEPILDRKKWDAVRAVLTDPARRSSHSNRRRWLLSGIAQCGRCEEPTKMRSIPHKSGARYVCPKCHLSIDLARTDDIVERDLLALLDPKAWRHLRRGQPTVVDTSGYEAAMQTLTARFVAGDIDEVQLGDLAGELRRQQEVVSAPPPPLPDVDDVRPAWPKLTLEQKRLVIIAATESLVIRPWTPCPRFDETRVEWVPVP